MSVLAQGMWTATRYGVGALAGSTGFVSLNPYLSVGGGISYWRDTDQEDLHLYWNAGVRLQLLSPDRDLRPRIGILYGNVDSGLPLVARLSVGFERSLW